MIPTKAPTVQEYCIKHGHGTFVEELDGLVCLSCQLPSDYEACGDCGFDHAYEYQEAFQWHANDLQERGVVCSESCVLPI